MRSELVFAAKRTIINRFTLCTAAAKATRLFHVDNTRIQDTTNDVLQRFASQHERVLRSDHAPMRRGPGKYANRREHDDVA